MAKNKKTEERKPDWRSKPRKPEALKKSITMSLRLTENEFNLITEAAEELDITKTELLLYSVRKLRGKI